MRPPLRTRVAGYVALTKPRIIELLLVTTVPTMIVAERGMPAAVADGGHRARRHAGRRRRQRHQHVRRPRHRRADEAHAEPARSSPGVIEPRHALVFAIALEVVAFAWLWAFVNLLSAVLAVAACLFYVFVYTLWLKRTSSRNIVIGGAAGAVPVLIGWTAVTDQLAWAPVVLFAVIFFWTPPHFWALAIRYKDDYAAADVPMLPSVASFHTTAIRILLYTLVLWALTLVFAPVAHLGVHLPGQRGRAGRRVHVPGRRWCCAPSRPSTPCACSPTRSPTSPCCSGRWSSTSWCAMACERRVRSGPRTGAIGAPPGFSAPLHRMCRVLSVPRSGRATPVTDHACLAPGVRSGVSVTTRSSLH